MYDSLLANEQNKWHSKYVFPVVLMFCFWKGLDFRKDAAGTKKSQDFHEFAISMTVEYNLRSTFSVKGLNPMVLLFCTSNKSIRYRTESVFFKFLFLNRKFCLFSL